MMLKKVRFKVGEQTFNDAFLKIKVPKKKKKVYSTSSVLKSKCCFGAFKVCLF